MKLIDFITTLTQKSGVDPNNDGLKNFLLNADLGKIEMPDEVVNKVNTSLLTMDAAKNNADLHKHFSGQTYNGIDAKLRRMFEELGYDASYVDEFPKETKTTDKIVALMTKIRDTEKAAAIAGKGKDSELTKQVNELNEKLATVVKQHKTELEAKDVQYKEQLTGYQIDNLLSGFDFVFPKEMPKETQVTTARAVLNSALLSAGVKPTLADGQWKLLRADGTEYYDDAHSKVSFKDFARKTLDGNKLLANSGGTPPADSQRKPAVIPGSGDKKPNQQFMDSVDQSLRDIEVSMQP